MSRIEACQEFLHAECKSRVWLTPSCTASLELSCGLIGLKAGDEVIVPAFTFPSVPNAVILRGAVPVFVDIRLDTLNLDESLVTSAITKRTKAIIVIHYGGVTADMGALRSVAKAHDLYLIEDAAQAIGSWQCSGDIGVMSFHETKNVGCGQGGAIFVRNLDLVDRVEALRDCGVSRNPKTGERYMWTEVGQSALMAEPCAELLWSRLQDLPEVTNRRRQAWQVYTESIKVKARARKQGNGHIFWFLHDDRDPFILTLRNLGVHATSHYEAAHLCAPGKLHGRIHGDLSVSERVASSIVRLPTDVSEARAREVAYIVNQVLMNGEAHERQKERRIRGVEARRGGEGEAAERAGDSQHATEQEPSWYPGGVSPWL